MTRKPLEVNWKYQNMPKTKPILFYIAGLFSLILSIIIFISAYRDITGLPMKIIAITLAIFCLLWAIREIKIGIALSKKVKGSIKLSKQYIFEASNPVRSWQGYYRTGLLSIIMPILILFGGLIFAYYNIATLNLPIFIIFILIGIVLLLLLPKQGLLLIRIANGLRTGNKKAFREARKHQIEQTAG